MVVRIIKSLSLDSRVSTSHGLLRMHHLSALLQVPALAQLKPALAVSTYNDQVSRQDGCHAVSLDRVLGQMVLLELFQTGSPERQQAEQLFS